MYHNRYGWFPNHRNMTITGIAITKAMLAAASFAAATGVAAVATGNAHGIMIALHHVPALSHAHSVLSQLARGTHPHGKA